MDVLESHKGADTMAAGCQRTSCSCMQRRRHTILDENVEAFLDEQGVLEDDKAIAKR